MTAVKITFWLCLALIFYTYIGYGVVLYIAITVRRYVCRRYTGKPDEPADDDRLPKVTMLICAYNEEDVVDMKMENIRRLDYPVDKLRVMWVTDGSNDSTNDLLAIYKEADVRFMPERKGKAAAINRAIPLIDTDIVIMTDANTMINAGAVREIVDIFRNPEVGCVAGEKRVMARTGTETVADGEGLYWKYESRLKKWDSELYSAMGAAGELCAIRRNLFERIPEDTLLDDFVISMNIVDKGYRIAYTSEAYAMEYGSADINEESKRKQRIAAGGLQSIWRLRNLMNPFRSPVVAFQFVSHRVLRWSVTPVAMMAVIPLNVVLVFNKTGIIYNIIWIMQIVFYFSALAGYVLANHGHKNRLLYVPYYFLFMNTNVFRGFAYLGSHKNSGVWEKAKRG